MERVHYGKRVHESRSQGARSEKKRKQNRPDVPLEDHGNPEGDGALGAGKGRDATDSLPKIIRGGGNGPVLRGNTSGNTYLCRDVLQGRGNVVRVLWNEMGLF